MSKRRVLSVPQNAGRTGERLLDDAFAGVEPIDPAEVGRIDPPRRRTATAKPPGKRPAKPRFELERIGERVAGSADGLDDRTLARLAAGALPVESRLDLHGLDRGGARAALGRFLATSRALGHRVVLVVHGRGRRSADGEAVLRREVPEWLADGGEGEGVEAIVSAPPKLGDVGALLLLLRRN